MVTADGVATAHPALTRSELERNPLWPRFTPFVSNEPWASFVIHDVEIGGCSCVLVLWFHEAPIWRATLGLAGGRPFHEQDARELHVEQERWLRRTAGRRRRFPWGSVWCEYDPRSASGSIGIDYRPFEALPR